MSNLIVIAGGGGFIGGAFAKKMLDRGLQVRCVDIKPISEWYQVHEKAENKVANLELKEVCYANLEGAKEVYNFACNMGGMGFIEAHKAECMISVLINTHLLMAARDLDVEKYFFASSACVYPDYRQRETESCSLREDMVYPAMPEDGYGWEKLFSERMCQNFHEDYGLDVRVARFHNVYGPHGAWCGGREKAPAAISRKVAEAIYDKSFIIEVWGDGEQTRSFMHIDDCITGIIKLMDSAVVRPINIGSREMVTINELVDMLEVISGFSIKRKYKLDAPLGVRGRNSDNSLILDKLNWEPSLPLIDGMRGTFEWIQNELIKIKRNV